MRLTSIKNYVLSECFKIRLKPQTIQLPITGRCNSRCATCNIWKHKESGDIDPIRLKKAFQDEYFSEVRNVGINGGEPFLHRDFISVIHSVLTLKKIRALYIITNGVLTKRITDTLAQVKKVCDTKNVKIYLTISLDGIEEVYGRIRGIPQAYNCVIKTIKTINQDLKQYCTSLTIGTTISKGNVGEIAPIKVLAKQLNIPVNYHIAVPNRRIYTNDVEEYSVLNDKKSLYLAKELFYGLFKYSPSIKQKLLYFQNYYYLISDGKQRISACTYKAQDLTLDENLNMYFCAKESKSIGNVTETNARAIIKSQGSKVEHRRIMKCCKNCGHYITLPTIKGIVLFCAESIKPSVWLRYKVYATIRRII